jgi:hypothetical protein
MPKDSGTVSGDGLAELNASGILLLLGKLDSS